MRSFRNTIAISAAVAEDSETEIGPFVLNLCPVREHISIPQPRSSQLIRYAFFLSRGHAGRHERYWLHMGYFATRAEAQKWLEVLQRVYPEASITSAAVTFVSDPLGASLDDAGQKQERVP
jgi:hypothetical protein